MSETSTVDSKTFLAYMRGQSAVVFRKDSGFKLKLLGSAVGEVDLAFSTRWVVPESGVSIPGNLCLEIRGGGTDLHSALEPLCNCGLFVIPVIALAHNAAVSVPQLEVAYDATPGLEVRDFLQQHLRGESGEAARARLADPGMLAETFDTIANSPDRERLVRALNQYALALESWRDGEEIICVAHLWMAVEALTPVQRRALAPKEGADDPAALAVALGISTEGQDRRQVSANVDAAVRRDFLLHGDADCYSRARKASDGLEHGYHDYTVIRTEAAATRKALASHVRRSIVRLCGANSSLATKLLSSPYDVPMSMTTVIHRVVGKLKGSGDCMAPGQAHPFLRWNIRPVAGVAGPDGTTEIRWSCDVSPDLAPGISLSVDRYEVLDPSGATDSGVGAITPDE